MDAAIKKELEKLNVLVVAHDMMTVASFHELFKEYGAKVTFANDEKQAMGNVQSPIPPDVILLELEAAVFNAFSFLRKVKASSAWSPPVFLLAKEIDPYFDNAFYEGAEGIFVKPLNLKEIAQGIASPHAGLLHRRDRQHLRKRLCQAKVTYNVDAQSGTGFATNVSAEGMFIGTMGSIPAREQKLQFHLSVAGKTPVEIKGVAEARWSRSKIEFGRPRGFGVRIVETNDLSRKLLASLGTA